MRVFLLILAVTAISAKIDVDVRQSEILTYNIVGRSYAALNSVQNEWSGTLYNATLQYEQTSQGTWGTLTNLTLNEVQGALWNNWNPTHENSQPMNVTGQKFGFVYENDKISKIQVVEGTPLWEVNIIRSIVNLFQLSKQDHRVMPSKINSLQNGREPYAVFVQKEPAIDGICETLYELTPLPEGNQFEVPLGITTDPKNWVQYVKTTNFSNCDKLPFFNVGLPPADGRIGSNRMGEFFSRANVGKIVRSGLTGPILRSQATSSVIVSPEVYNSQRGDVFSQMTMNLTSTKYQVRVELENKAPVRDTKYITYTLLNDMSGKPFQEVEGIEKESSSESSSESLSTEHWQATRSIQDAPWDPSNFFSPDEAIGHIETLLKNISALEPEDGGSRAGLENFMLLTSVLRTLGYNQINATIEKYYSARSTNINATKDWLNIRDAVTQAGTAPSFLIIRNLIESKKVIGEEAARMISAQTNAIRDPHVELIQNFFELIKSQTVSESFVLTTACSSAFTNLVRLSIVDINAARRLYPVRANGPMALTHIKAVDDVYVPFYGQKLKESVAANKSHLVQLYIHCLGNIAMPTILETFEPYLEGKQQLSTLQRTLLVVSLRKLAGIYPTQAMSVLYKLYSNEFEPYQVRVAAIYNLMETNPPADMLQRMATYGNVEKSQQVRAALKTSIESAAKLTGEWNIERRRNAQAAVDLLPAEAPGMQYSRQHLVDYIFHGLIAIESEISYIGSDDDLTPQAVFARGAEYYNSVLTTGYSFSGMISSMKDLVDFMASNSERSEDFKINEEVEKLKDMLKSLKLRVKSTKELEGNVQMNFAGVERFFSFNNSTMKISSEVVIKTFLGLLGGLNFNYQSRNIQNEMVIAFPTAMGFPYIFKFAQTSVLAVSGSLKADFGILSQTRNITIEPNMTVTYASLSQGHMQFVSYGNRSNMAGNDRTFRLSAPISGKLSIDLQNKTTQISFDFKDHKEIDMMSFNAEAFTAIGDVRKPILKKELEKYQPLHVRPSHQVETKVKTMVPGVTVHVNGVSEKDSISFFNNIIPALGFALPMAEQTIEPSDFRLHLEPDQLESIVLRIGLESQQEAKSLDEKETEQRQKMWASLELNGPVAEKYDVELSGNLDTQTPNVFFKAHSNSAFYSISIDGKLPDTSLYNFKQALRPQKESLVHIAFTHGPLHGQRETCKATIQMQRTHARLNHVRNQPQAQQCYKEMEQGNSFHYGCRNATFHAGLYDHYNVEVSYHGLSDSVREKVARAFGLAQHWGYSYLSQEKSSKTEDTLRATVQYSPNLKNVDIELDSTAGKFRFNRIPVPNVVRSFTVVHPKYSVADRVGFGAFRQQWKPTCSVDETMMNTFDNCTHRFNPAENYWTVLAVSDPELLLSQQDQFLILHRVGTSGLRQISAIFGGRNDIHNVEIQATFSQLRVLLGKQVINLNEGQSKGIFKDGRAILKITNIGQNQIKITTPKIEVVHMPTRSVITLKTTKPVMGLCGDNNHEPYDMITPRGMFVMDADEFIASWTLNAQGSVQKLQRQANQHGIQKQAPYHSNIISEQDAGRANSRGQPSKRPRYYDASSPESRSVSQEDIDEPAHNVMKRLMVVEKGLQLCFSTEFQNACKQGRKMIASARRKVSFVCLPNDHISLHWKMLVNHGARPDFRKKGNPQSIEVDVPLKCSK